MNRCSAALAVGAILASAWSCKGADGPVHGPKDMVREKPDREERIDTAVAKRGEATRYSTDARRDALWSIRWGDATISYDGSGNMGGSMNGVDGQLFKQGIPASRFRAGQAKTEFASRRLSLSGGVRLFNKEPAAELSASDVVWNPDLERIEAHGKVMLKAGEMEFGPFENVYATPDLGEISTPDLFRKEK